MKSEQFNLSLALDFKERGITAVAGNNRHFLTTARNIAIALCKQNGSVTADDVRRNCPLEPLHPNAWGGIFRGKQWRFTGQFKQSDLVSRRGGYQRVWVLDPTGQKHG